MVTFWSLLGSRTWCPSDGLRLWASSCLTEHLAALYPNSDSIVFSSNSKELDRILSHTIRRLGAARTLSQCSGFSFGSGAPFLPTGALCLNRPGGAGGGGRPGSLLL
uniref:Uncharacterized protein n=1 Tax=Arundo donax TaxID=35708 RepID=A0A0A9CVK0_ARUDO